MFMKHMEWWAQTFYIFSLSSTIDFSYSAKIDWRDFIDYHIIIEHSSTV